MRHLERACFGALLMGTLVAGASPTRAETMKECSVKFQAAKQGGTLNGADWKTFRATQCSKTASAAATTAPASGSPVAAAGPTVTTDTAVAAPSPAPATKRSASSGDAPVATGNASFPGKIDAKYASLTPGRARMKTCDDQYKLNKANGGNGGMKWLQKGGGYYSACVKHLKAG